MQTSRNKGIGPEPDEDPSMAVQHPLEERHFTIREVAEMWNLSDEFIRQLVRDEPGVTEWVRQAPGRRCYRVLRIPESVVERLHRRAQERHEEEVGRKSASKKSSRSAHVLRSL